MKKSDGILAAVALVSAVIYAVACRPAWHPSGKTVAFPFVDEETSGIALYDTESTKVSRLVEEAGESYTYAHCLWSADGKALLAVAPTEDDGLRVLRIDPSVGKAEAVATIAGLKDQDREPLVLPPFLAGGRYLWIGYLVKEETEEYFHARVDLRDGKVEEFFNSTDKVTVCFDFPGRGHFYLEAVTEREGAEGKFTIGTLNPTSGERKQLFTLPEGVYQQFIAAEPGGESLAVLVGKEEKPFLRVMDLAGKIVKDIALPEGLEGVGYMTWVGGSIWMGAAQSRSEGEETIEEAGLLRVEMATGKTRFISLGEGTDDNVAALTLQPSVSPDGKRLAVAGHFLEPAEGERPTALRGRLHPIPGPPEPPEGERPTALVLFDLTAPDKAPTRIPLPAVERPAAAAEKEAAEAPASVEGAGTEAPAEGAAAKPVEDTPAEGSAEKAQ